MRDRRLWVILVAALAALAMLPAQALPDVTPTFVAGSSNCASVGSTGTQVTANEPAVGVNPVNVSGVVGGQIQIFNVERKEFDFTATGVVVLDVVVKGSGSNHYDYGLSGIAADDGLKIPNGNKLNWVHFCYAEVPTFSISGNKFEDANADGLHQETEIGLSGWTIQVKQGVTVLKSTTTGEGGAYSFSGLEAGEYQVCEILPEGEDWVQTFPDGCHQVIVGPEDPDAGDGKYFLNTEGVDICEGASTPEGNTSATFAFVGECEPGQKVAELFVEGDEIVFIPKGDGTAEYQGTLTFRKDFDDPELLVLLYNPDPDGEAFDPVPACVDETELPENGDWCYFGVHLLPVGGGLYDVEWQVFGQDDPRFK